jgi:hypothetical protein
MNRKLMSVLINHLTLYGIRSGTILAFPNHGVGGGKLRAFFSAARHLSRSIGDINGTLGMPRVHSVPSYQPANILFLFQLTKYTKVDDQASGYFISD